MSRALMGRRCPTAQALGPARLDGWRYFISGDGYASVRQETGATVHGVLWHLRPRDLAALRAYECLDSGLYARRLLTARYRGKCVRALVYVGRNCAEGRPRPAYHDGIVLPSARDWALPVAYLAELARWSRRDGQPLHGRR